MHHEIDVAARFLAKLAKVDEKIVPLVVQRLRERYEGHWEPSSPLQGSGFRCIHSSRLEDLQLADDLPNLPCLTLWVDPGAVEYKIGDRGSVCPLYVVGGKSGAPSLSPSTPPSSPSQFQRIAYGSSPRSTRPGQLLSLA